MPSLIAVLRNYMVPSHLVDIISAMYTTNTWCQVRTTEGASEKFKVVSGVRQACIYSHHCSSTVSWTGFSERH